MNKIKNIMEEQQQTIVVDHLMQTSANQEIMMSFTANPLSDYSNQISRPVFRTLSRPPATHLTRPPPPSCNSDQPVDLSNTYQKITVPEEFTSLADNVDLSTSQADMALLSNKP